MDPQAPAISTEQSEHFETMLQQMDPLLVQGYRKFLHEVITQGISCYNFTLNTLNSCLLNFNQEAIEDIVSKAISHYEVEAPEDVKFFGL